MQRLAAATLVAAHLLSCHGGTEVDTAVHQPPAPQFAQVCGVDGWCWDNPLPGASQINALWGSAWNDIWAGGRDGLLHFDGRAWKVAPLPGGSATVRSLWGSGAQDVWAAGDSVFHWNGNSWSAAAGLPAGSDQNYLAITGSGRKDVWLLVDTGNGPDERHAILHWDGTAWATQYGPVAPTLQGIFAARPGVAWAVGVELPAFKSQVLRLSGSAWTIESVPAGGPLSAVWASGPSDVWAVGLGTALHWDGKSWSSVPIASSVQLGLRSVFGSGPADVWAGGGGALVHWDGSTWSLVYGGTSLDGRAVRAIFSTGPRNSWAAGEAGLLLHQDGSLWTSYSQGPIEYLDAAYARSANDAWAVGGYGVALHYDGTGWVQVPTQSTDPLYGVWSSAPNDAWIIGATGDCQGFILHWNGAVWAPSLGPIDSTCTSSIWGTSKSDVWTIGNHQSQHWNGAGWSPVGPADVAGAGWAGAPDDVWVLQESIQGGSTPPGGVYHFDGANWTLMATGTSAQLHTLFGTGPRDVWITSEDAANVLHWDGSSWSAIPTGITSDGASVGSIGGSGLADLWLGGSNTPILHWDGHSWSASGGAETRLVSALTGAGGRAWAVGGGGSIWGHGN